MAADSTAVYVADSANNALRKFTIATGAVTTLATGFNGAAGAAVDGSGNVFVADTLNHVIKKVTAGGVVTVQSGSSGTLGSTNSTMALSRFFNPQGIAVNSAGTFIYVADSGNNLVRRIDVANDAVTTIASGFKPYGMVLNAAGTVLYVADYDGHSVRSVTLGANTLATVAGSVGTSGSADSPASFKNPSGVAIDSAGDLYVTDTGNQLIRKISGATVTTIAGGLNQQGNTDGAGTIARLNGPFGIVATAVNTFYFSDGNAHTIRRATPAVAAGLTAPSNTSGAVNANVSFSVVVSGNPTPTVQWERQPSGGSFAAITAGGAYSGVTSTTLTVSGLTTGMNGDQFRAVATNGVGSAATSAAATLTVTQPPVFTSAASAGFTLSTASTFQATATGSPAPTFSVFSGSFPPWASLNTSTGVISGTPSNTTGSPFSFVIRANNTGGNTDQTFTLTVLTGPTITTQPTAQTVSPSQNAQFTVAATSNGGTLTYQWQYQPVGTSGFTNVPSDATYLGGTTATLTVVSPTQPMSGNQFRVVVSSGAGTPATSNAVSLTVTQAPQITSLNSASFVESQSGSFTVQATGSPAPSFTLTSGTLPSGLSLNALTGQISGTPNAGTSTSSPYSVQITASNGVNPGAVQTLTLTVTPTAVAPTFTTQPVSLTVALGQTATFTVAVTGNPTPSLRWQRYTSASGAFNDLNNDSTFSGVTGATLTIVNPTSGMSGDQYRATATSSSGTTFSSSASLTLVIGTTITTLAGQATVSGSVDGTGAAARFNGPASVAVDSSGIIYIADSSNHIIRKVTSAGVVTTLAGTAGVSGSADGTGSAARFNAPSGIAVSGLGTVYVADTYNHIIRVISPEGVVTTLAGLAGNTGSTDATGSAARFLYPYGIALDSGGTVYVADTFNHTIRRVTGAGVVSIYAGTAGARGTANGAGVAARFAYPFAIAVDSTGNLYVADSFNHAIRKIDTGANVTNLAGTSGTAGTTDGTGTAALFNQPSGIAVDTAGNVYVADTYSHTLRKITGAGVVTTLSGLAGTAGSVDGVGSAARLNQPFGIALDSSGNIYVADTRNHTVRRSGNVTAPTITTQPQSAVATAGGTATIQVAASGAPTPSIFTWLRQPAGSTGFSSITADSVYSGVNSATLTITGVTDAMNGDQFQVVVSNLISPNATSNNVLLTVGTAPVITSAASATFQATNAGSFTVVATGSPAPTFSATGLPSWATLDTTTGVLSGTPPDTTGSPITITITASNGIPTSQVFTLTVLPAVLAPTITSHPANATVDQGSSAVFSVAVSGTAPFTYQWSRNGAPISGATGANLTLGSVQASVVGSYSVTVTNAAGAVTSSAATLVVNTAPVLTLQPRTQTALAGSVITFAVTASGGTSFNYQWRKNGVQITGATGATLTLTGVTAADVGNYDVLVSNALGTVGSSLAQLNVVSAPVAPVITAQPGNRTVAQGGSVTLTVGASGAPSPSYQWRRNGVAIAGATTASFVVAGVSSNAGSYDVVITNSAGTVSTSAATVRVLTRSYAGTYFGSFGGGLGTFALYVRDDNTGVLLGYLPGSTAPVMGMNFTVSDSGGFTFTQAAIASTASVSPNEGEPARAAALSALAVSGSIAADGGLTGAIAGGANASLTATRASDSGATQGYTGFYQAGSSNSAGVSYTIAGPNSQAFVLVQSGTATDGGTGTVTVAGAVNVVTSRSVLSATISPANGTVTAAATGAVAGSFVGASESANARQRLVNISSRARVASGDNVAIAGFVISGEESKPVLIRAVGPTLGGAPFNVPGALASPRLELFRGQTSLAVNTGIASNRAAIDAAGAQSGAFALNSSGSDAAILTTLAPGAYTAIVSSTTNTAGVALVEVYDLSAAAPGQKLLNIATRASAGANENTLIAGFVVPPGAAKRVLVRGVGPGLAVFGVTGVLAQPTLQLLSGSTTVAQNTNWTTSTDRDAISSSSAQVGAFGMASGDSAVIATLAPGNYTATVVGAGGATGVALIEVYELP